MKLKSTCFVGIFCLLSVFVIAQTRSGTISGQISDANAQGVESATASLQRAKDSVLVKVAVSDKKGNFEFEQLAEGEYFVIVTAVGFVKSSSKSITVKSASPVQLPVIQLQKAQAKTLGEVTVTGKRPLIENKIGAAGD